MKRVGIMAMVLFVIIIYSNSFTSGWHFDDYPNIIDNTNVKVSELNIEMLTGCLKGFSSEVKFDRPVAYLSFALNWVVGGGNVAGFHVVNILIHIGCSLLLLFCVFRLSEISYPSGLTLLHWQIALFSSLIWAIHPIQVPAVTYIVQRMALLAALFNLLALLMYITVRMELGWGRWNDWCVIGLMVLLSVASKQNGILVLGSFLLVELCFFSEKYSEKNRRRFIWFLFGLCAVAFLTIIGLFQAGHFSYATRSFTLYERLLTQSRVFWFYLGLIFYPVADRFSIVHDYTLSKGLFHPFTTILSLIGIILLVVSALRFRYKYKALSFGILFFALNHLVESSFIPLEMIFEHRNYLPSMFLFVPMGGVLVPYVENFVSAKKAIVVLLGALCLMALGLGTYSINYDWADEEALWSSALSIAPTSARPHQNLSIAKWDNGSISIEKFYSMNDESERMHDDTRTRGAYVSIMNKIKALKLMGRYDEALAEALRLKQLDANDMISAESVAFMITELKIVLDKPRDILNDYYEDGLVHESLSQETSSDIIKRIALVGSVAIKLKQYDETYSIGIRLLKAGDNSFQAYPLMAMASLLKGNQNSAEHYLKLAERDSSNILLNDIIRFELLKRNGAFDDLKSHAKSTIFRHGIQRIVELEKSTDLKFYPVPMNYSIVDELDAICQDTMLKDFLDDHKK